jgi:hypothetical protein
LRIPLTPSPSLPVERLAAARQELRDVRHMAADNSNAGVVATGAAEVGAEEVRPMGTELHMCVDGFDLRTVGLGFAVIKAVPLGVAIAFAGARADAIAAKDRAMWLRRWNVSGLGHLTIVAW